MRPFGTEVDASGDVIGTYDEPWSVRSYAICADPLAGQQIVTRLSDIGSLHTQLTSKLCPTGKRLLGTGFDVVGGSGEVGVVQLAPIVDGAHHRRRCRAQRLSEPLAGQLDRDLRGTQPRGRRFQQPEQRCQPEIEERQLPRIEARGRHRVPH